MTTVEPMSERPPMKGVTAYIQVKDAAAAMDFYARAFDAQEVDRLLAEDGKRIMHGFMMINGGPLMLSDSFPEYGYPDQTPQSFTLHVHVDDARGWVKRAVDAGAEVTMPLDIQFWGDLYGQIRDPFGVTWSIGETPKK